jgi:hypothetical protein
MISPVSPSVSATSSPSLMVSSSVERVTGNRPEQAVGHLVAVAHALPVGLGHEAVQRGEAADTHHDEVAGFTRGHLELGQGSCAGFLGSEGVASEQEGLEFTAAVGAYQSGHAISDHDLWIFESSEDSTGGAP